QGSSVAQNDDESTYLIALQEKSTKIDIPTYFLSEKLQKSQDLINIAVNSKVTNIIPDLNSRIRFGSDMLYIQRPDDYEININESRKDMFFNAIKTCLPTIKRDKLYANYTRIR
ncbi:34829_t:CDS:2, partial [Gigaspora margarita]